MYIYSHKYHTPNSIRRLLVKRKNYDGIKDTLITQI